jgi:hypothetical protein
MDYENVYSVARVLNKVTNNKWYSDIDQIDKGSKFIVIDAMYIPIKRV